jgi:hypothetical protein
MSKISLSFYFIKLHPPRKTANFSDLDNLAGRQKDAFLFIKSYLSQIPLYDKSITANHEIFSEKDYIEDGRRCYGRVIIPNEGYASNIHSSDGKHQYTRNKDDKEFMPFYYMVDIPQNSKTGIVIIQRQGQHSPLSLFLDPLAKQIRNNYSDYVLKSGPIHLGGLFFNSYLTDGQIKEVEVLKYGPKSDKATKQYDRCKYNFSISPVERGKFLPNTLNKLIQSAYANKESQKEIIGKVSQLLAIPTEDYEDMSFLIDLNGTQRKVDLGSIDNFATRFDITDKITLDNDGFPKVSEIHREAMDILKTDIRGKLIKD